MDTDLNDIAMFAHVARAGSFSAAARALGVPVSTLSVRVGRLEKALGVTLMQRTTRRLALTEAGRAYLARAQEGLEALAQAEGEIQAGQQEAAGLLRLSLPRDMMDTRLMDFLCGFRAHHPQVRIELLFTDRWVDLVGEGVDLALRAGRLPDSSLMARQVGQARWQAFAHPDYLRARRPIRQPADLAHHDCLCFSALGIDEWTLSRGPRSVRQPVRGVYAGNDMHLIRELALAAQGVALLPAYTCAPARDAGELQAVLPAWTARLDPIHLVYPRQGFVPAKVRVFIDEVAPLLAAIYAA